MSLFTLGSARAVLVVALVYSFPDVFNVTKKENHSQLSLKCSRVRIEMNYEKVLK
jgi:hypothetical protein